MSKKSVKKTAGNTSSDFNFSSPKNWEEMETVESEKVKDFRTFKGFEIWLAPFTSPDKDFRHCPKEEIFIVHVVTWGKKFLVKRGKKKANGILAIV